MNYRALNIVNASDGTEFDFNIQYLVREFPDYRKTISQARWDAKMPEKQNLSDIDIMRKIQGADNAK